MLALYIFLSLTRVNLAEMEGFIVGGSYASINRYPHAASLFISCICDRNMSNYICGSSIVNEKVIVTAGHCLYNCNDITRISISLGTEIRQRGTKRTAKGFIVHGKYNPQTLMCDIAMLRMSHRVQFGPSISRVAIMPTPPYKELAMMAGWGQTDDDKTQGIFLKELDQRLIKHVECMSIFGFMPRGTICARSKSSSYYAAPGDSGSGLVVRNYILIGLVSFKRPSISENVIVYTDIGYYYDWITYIAKTLYCHAD